jgi:serine protein kinase
MGTTALFDRVASGFDKKEFLKLHETISFPDYLARVENNPLLACSAYQRLYRMIVSKGVERFKRYNKTIKRYKFFSDNPYYPVFGLEESLEGVVKHIKGAAGYFGTEKRILLLHGPVGSSKSTICRAIKRGLEDYTATDEGALYTFSWKNLPDDLSLTEDAASPMHDDPIRLIPVKQRPDLEDRLNDTLQKMTLSEDEDLNREMKFLIKIRLPGDQNPHDQYFFDTLLKKEKGDWKAVMEKHILVHRLILSESKRVGIGTFQPKDEKNQDATELTGDVNYMKLGKYGVDSDPRAFNFDGEFEVAHRGFLEMIEMLKLNQEFLYDLLGAAQEQQVKPKKFPQVFIDTVIFGHTNHPEYQRLEKNECMEALRDRTVRNDVPYLLRWSDEIRVLEQDYNPKKVRQHIAPHTIRIAALFAILTRLHNVEGQKIDPLKKAKLYDGQEVSGITEDTVKELKDAHPTEGLDRGISARYVQNKVSNALVSHHEYVNPFMVLHELKEGLKNYSAIGDDENLRASYEHAAILAKEELEEILKNEVRRALTMDDDVIQRMFLNYIDNVFAYIEDRKIHDEYTGEYRHPDERLMRSIEEKIEIPEQGCNDFRRSIAAFVGSQSRPGMKDKGELRWDKNPDLARALELKLFEDTKDSIKLSSLTKVVGQLDPEEQKNIERVKKRLVEHYGYNEQSATDVLHYVGSIFARGDIMEPKK